MLHQFPPVPVIDLCLVNPDGQLRLRKFLERSRKRGRTRYTTLPGSDSQEPNWTSERGCSSNREVTGIFGAILANNGRSMQMVRQGSPTERVRRQDG